MTTRTVRPSDVNTLAAIRDQVANLIRRMDHNLAIAATGRSAGSFRSIVRDHEIAARNITADLSGLATRIFNQEMTEATAVDNASTPTGSAWPGK